MMNLPTVLTSLKYLKRLRNLYLFLFATLWISAGHSEDLQIFTTEVPPMIFKKDGQLEGFCIELVHEIQKRIGDQTPIQMVPWARAFMIGQKQPNVILVCPKRTKEREKMFKWVGPVLDSSTNLYMKSDSKLQIRNLKDARKASGVIVPRASYIYPKLVELGFPKLVVTDNSLSALEMLLKDRHPLVALEEIQISVLLKGLNRDPKEVLIAYKLTPSHSYLSFSKQLPDEVIQRWQKALEQIKKDGTYEIIHRRWFN